MTKVIDAHAHILSEETMRLMSTEAPGRGPRLLNQEQGFATLEMMGRTRGAFPQGAWDLETRLRIMDDNRIDMQVLSVVPHTLVYGLDPALAKTFAHIQNEQIAAEVRQRPDRFFGLAHLPMQDPKAAAEELRRAVTQLGLRGAMLGSHIDGKNLDDPDLEGVWETADELGALLFIHPQKPAGADRTGSYYLVNLIGNPLDTTIAAASLVFGGVFQRHPRLKVLLSHGGGFTPYQFGRWIHGWHERAEAKVTLKVSPEEDLKRFYYDTLTHSLPTLCSLIEWSGSGRVVFGTDFPFDMGEFDCADRVRELKLPPEDQANVLGRVTARLLETSVSNRSGASHDRAIA